MDAIRWVGKIQHDFLIYETIVIPIKFTHLYNNEPLTLVIITTGSFPYIKTTKKSFQNFYFESTFRI